MASHLEQASGICGVVAIISKRFGNRLRHNDRSRKMNDLRNPILRDQRRNSPLIPDVLNENRNSGWYCPFEARRKIIDHDGQFARSASSYTMWLPMYPAPPVIRIAIAIALGDLI
jgi:hypothetical protein